MQLFSIINPFDKIRNSFSEIGQGLMVSENHYPVLGKRAFDQVQITGLSPVIPKE
jgi:hypothetical protein